MIIRNFYLNQIIKNMWSGDIKVITGIRRSGKSVLLMDMFKEHLIKVGTPKKNILMYALDQRKFVEYRNPIVLSSEIEDIVKSSSEQYYVFIDEIQLSIHIEDKKNKAAKITVYELLNELKSYKNLDIYVTGSNSKMLSKDILTEFRGRSTQIHVYPLSFEEFYSANSQDETKALNEYLLYGGMPRLLSIKDDHDKKKYLKTLYDEVYIKDIQERNTIEKPHIMNQILDYLSSQIGSLTNPSNISNVLTHEHKESINQELVSRYIDIVEDAFLLSTVKRYDIKGKTYFKYPNKYYFVDLGLRNARLNFRQYDLGHLMENLIYNELIRRGYSVDIGVVIDRRQHQNAQKEIDFIVNDGDRRIYIQSALRIDDIEKEKTETDSFKLTQDFFKKILIRNDISHNYYDENGFYHCNLIDFLLMKIELF
jgi:uncharacterized protein